MKKISITLLALLFILPLSAAALNADDLSTPMEEEPDSALVAAMAELREALGRTVAADTAVVNRYNQLLDILIQRRNEPMDDNVDLDDDGNPLFFRLIPPITLYSSPMRNALSLTPDSTANDSTDAELAPSLLLPWKKDLELMDELDKLLLVTYMDNPSQVRQTEEQLMQNSSVSGEIVKKSSDNAVLNIGTTGTLEPVAATGPKDMVVNRPNFWSTRGSMSHQWTENYYTANWYQGGTASVNIMSLLNLEANYNDQQKVSWNNLLEAKVGFYMNNFYKSIEEGRSKIQSNTDLLRFTSTLNLKAIKSWNYSIKLLAYTQMMNVYNGDETVKSCFLSPAYGNLSIGMNWAKNFKKGNMSIFIGPLTYNCRYVNDPYVLAHGGYIPGGAEEHPHGYYNDLGSQVQITYNVPITKTISYNTRAYYYTTFHYVQCEWENTFNFQVSKYLSAKLFLHPRYDDSRAKDEKLGHLMFKEYITMGFNYSW